MKKISSPHIKKEPIVCLLWISSCLASCVAGGGERAGVGVTSFQVVPADEAVQVVQPKTLPQGSAMPAINEESGVIILAKKFRSYSIHQDEINSVSVRADGQAVFSGGSDGQIFHTKIISLGASGKATEVQSEKLVTSESPILAVALSPSEQLLAFSQFSSVTVLDLQTRSVRYQLRKVRGRITALGWDPREELLAIGGSDGEVYVWNIKDSTTASDLSLGLEHYQSGTSPIVSLLFHPSSRVFFIAEQNGVVRLQRLFRTEREMGIRDDSADVDRESWNPVGMTVASPGVRLEDIWLSAAGDVLNVANSGGAVSRLKIRGLTPIESVQLPTTKIRSVWPVRISVKTSQYGRESVELLASTSRDQRLQFWCMNNDLLPESSGAIKLVAESERFLEPLSKIYLGRDSMDLWVVQKKGNLLRFDASQLSESPPWAEHVLSCRG